MLKLTFFAGLLISTTLITGCFHDDETGVCVSDFNNSNRQYCYSNFDKSECDDYNSQQVNGANWFFHGGQTCADRGLSEGSNR